MKHVLARKNVLLYLFLAAAITAGTSGCSQENDLKGKSVDELIKLLDSGGTADRVKAAEALGFVEDKTDQDKAIAALIDSFRDSEKMVRARSIKALGQIGQRAEKPLQTSLRKGGTLIKWHAAQALKAIGTPSAVNAYSEYMATEGKNTNKIKVGTG